ncbi:lytic transglycosylase domain-containing protein [Paenibacillus sp. IB182496]|uniref:Lytic transglycosylase domain-containing protein n=1 Tax=Paenibacillus sabuli TaxID=2772509 RepID=A0A927BTH8_9BACL|nr:lytic transglycosylase domain-containing protein [Paenibacillus sabuli]MBD2846508.1 lytic transglycosylase domain-containing protein [Paenibacillus sabuli]
MKKRRRKGRRILLLLVVGLVVVLLINSEWIGRWMYPVYYRDDIRISAQNYEVEPHLVAAIIRSESNYQTGRESRKGALGMMQIMPETANWIAEQADFTVTLDDVHHRPDVAIEMGAWYIQSLQKQFGENRVAVVAAYNAGPGKVSSWLSDGVWDGQLDSLDEVPYGETRHYVRRVMFYYNKYKDLYPSF